jgi:NAD-dependent dihydropyrimidine dehydrogenase PreA subunit
MPKPVIIDEKKVDCKIVDVCPVHVFDCKNGKLTVARPKDCIGCRACEASSDGIKVEDD